MLEIKFRAKQIENGKWVYGYYAKNTEGRSFILKDIFVDKIYSPPTLKPSVSCYEIDPDTVCQYTWKKDKDNNEIYKDDILKLNYIECLFVVEFDKYRQFYGKPLGNLPPLHYSNFSESDLIGNIHDNPELLKGDENISDGFEKEKLYKKTIEMIKNF